MAFRVQSIVDRTSPTRQRLRGWPKIDLHCHLEGALRLASLMRIARAYDIPLPAHSEDQLRPFVQMTASDPSTPEALNGKLVALREFFRSPDVIGRMTQEAIQDAASDGVIYLELRMAPHRLAQRSRASYDTIIATVCQSARSAAQAAGIRARLVVTIDCRDGVVIAGRIMDALAALAPDCVVGLDVDGLTPGLNLRPFHGVFHQAAAAGLHLTLHGGQWATADNVRWAVENVGARRLSHCLQVANDPAMTALLHEQDVTLELCPTHSLQTGQINDLRDCPLDIMVEKGIPFTLNTANPGLSDTSMTDELALARVALGMTDAQLQAITRRAAQASFLPPDEKNALVRVCERAFDGPAAGMPEAGG